MIDTEDRIKLQVAHNEAGHMLMKILQDDGSGLMELVRPSTEVRLRRIMENIAQVLSKK